MASGSLKKRPKRLISTPYRSMASPRPSSFNYKTISLLISIFLILSVVFLLSLSSNMWSKLVSNVNSSQIYSIEVVNEFPHDPNAFTQGLLYGGNDTLYESTGLYRESSVRKVALQTGKVYLFLSVSSVNIFLLPRLQG